MPQCSQCLPRWISHSQWKPQTRARPQGWTPSTPSSKVGGSTSPSAPEVEEQHWELLLMILQPQPHAPAALERTTPAENTAPLFSCSPLNNRICPRSGSSNLFRYGLSGVTEENHYDCFAVASPTKQFTGALSPLQRVSLL